MPSVRVTAGGAAVLEEREEDDFGRFGWFVDPDGNRVELWEPDRYEAETAAGSDEFGPGTP